MRAFDLRPGQRFAATDSTPSWQLDWERWPGSVRMIAPPRPLSLRPRWFIRIQHRTSQPDGLYFSACRHSSWDIVTVDDVPREAALGETSEHGCGREILRNPDTWFIPVGAGGEQEFGCHHRRDAGSVADGL